MSDLSAEEVSDLFQSVQTIGKTIEKATNAKSLTIACQVRVFVLLWNVNHADAYLQDGPYAGN